MTYSERASERADLDLIVAVVVQHEYTEQFTVSRHDQIRHVLDALRQRLPRILLHLNVEELPARTTAPRNDTDATISAHATTAQRFVHVGCGALGCGALRRRAAPQRNAPHPVNEP